MAKAKKPVTDAFSLVVTSTAGAKFLKITSRWVQQLATDGWVKPVGRGKWNLHDLVSGYVASLKDEERRSSKSAADSRVRDARAAEIERRMAREDREIISLDEAIGAFDDATGAFLQALSGLPARITRNQSERRRIEVICDAERQRLTARFEEVASTLRTGRQIADASEEDDT